MEKADCSYDLRMELDVRIRKWMDLSEVDFMSGMTFRQQVEIFLEDSFSLSDGEGSVLYDEVTDFLCGEMLDFLVGRKYVVDFDVTTVLWKGIAKIFSDRGFDYWQFIMVNRNEPAVSSWLMAARYTLSHVSNYINRTPHLGPGRVSIDDNVASLESCSDSSS